MSKSEWKAVANTQHRHTVGLLAAGATKMTVVKVTNLSTERERKVTMCLAFCPECRSYLQALIWRRDSPLNDVSDDDTLWAPLEMPEVSQRRKAPTPA